MHRYVFFSLLAVVVGQLFFSSCQDTPTTSQPPKAVISQSPLIALTPTEYNNTVRDLLGMPSNPDEWPTLPGSKMGSNEGSANTWPWSFPTENGVDAFEGMAKGQATSSYQIERLQQAASYFSAMALRSTIFFACKNWSSLQGDAQKTCGWSSIERFAQRAWRRPLEAKERERLKAFWEANWKASKPDNAIQLTVAGVLQSPAFLYRTEQGNTDAKQGNAVPLSSWEMASRLSYFLWDSMPDQALFAAAANNQLQTPEQIAKQAKRMLKDPRARAAVVHFHNQWLGLNNIHTINPSRGVFGPLYGFKPKAQGPKAENDMLWPAKMIQVRQSMLKEVELFVEKTIFEGAGTLKALFTDNHGYISTHTKPLYGGTAKELNGPQITWTSRPLRDVFGLTKRISLTLTPAEFSKDQRAGLLTMPGVLALYAHPVHPSPILRGKFILLRLTCGSMGAPPPEAFGQEPADTVDAKGTNRERTEQATKPDGCASCHNTLNPPGFALENYDTLGRWRDKDNGKAVNAKATVKLGGQTFDVQNGVDLSRQLSNSEVLQNCYTLRWLRYATGVQIAPNAAGVKELQDAFRKNDNIKELLVSIVISDLFRYRNAGGTQP